MNNINFQTLESSFTLPCDITHETWFITRRGYIGPLPPVRREVYKMSDGSVVALRDSGVRVWDTALYVDEEFLAFFKGEPELEVVMSDQGITDYTKLKLFRMEE